MTWLLIVQTKNSGEHEIELGDDEANAKAALERAQQEWANRRRIKARGGGLVTFEDSVTVPADDVTAVSLRERHPPAIG